jgi:hypothetical protein
MSVVFVVLQNDMRVLEWLLDAGAYPIMESRNDDPQYAIEAEREMRRRCRITDETMVRDREVEWNMAGLPVAPMSSNGDAGWDKDQYSSRSNLYRH